MKYEDIKIDNIYKLKKSQKVWCIDIQQRIIFPEDENIYIKITNTVYNNWTLFGKVVEENAFGAIEKFEVEFDYTQLEETPIYKSLEDFNKSLYESKLMYLDFPNIGKPIDIIDEPGKYDFKEGDKVCYKLFPNIYIGYVSPDVKYSIGLMFDGKESKQIPIFTSDNWAKHFGHGICPNTLHVDENEIMLYKEDE